jgi:lysozyme
MTPDEKLNDEILRAELRRDEGWVVNKTYRCTEGKLSAGCGRNLDDVGILPSETALLGITTADARKKGVTDRQATILLDNDIQRSKADLDRVLPWWRTLDLVRQRVLINMCFNMGIGNGAKGLSSFRNTLRYIREGNYGHAADNMLASKWAGQVGARAKRLADLMRLGPKKL